MATVSASPFRRWIFGLALSGLCARVVLGQAASTDPPAPAVCEGQTISRIDVHAQPPFPLGGPWMLSRVAALATSFHSTTKEQIVRRYLTLHVGDPCVEFRRLESERILRAQPFLAAADIVVYPDSGGAGVVLDVATVDEVSLILNGGGALTAPLLRAFQLGEANLNGEAMYLSGAWVHSQFFRDVYRGRFTDYQFLGHPYQLSVHGSRDELGGEWDSEVSYPFLTDLQRDSWRMAAGSSDTYIPFRRPGAIAASLRFERAYGDIGGVHAFGPMGRRILIGGSFSRERERTAAIPVLVLDSGVFNDTSSVLTGRYGVHNASRLNLLLGYRDVHFMTVNGFDAPEGTQDVRTGFQLASLFGKGIKLSGDDEPDYFISGDVYAGAGSSTSFLALETMGEQRFDPASHGWDAILGSGRLAWYLKPPLGIGEWRNTLVSDLEFSGGWRQLVPFQLTLADREGGLPGYQSSDLAGGRRLVARIEDRYGLGHLRQFAGFTGAVFVDAGRLWAGDVPFGRTTGVKMSAGVSLLAAFPPNSRRAWRIDLAQPLNDRHDSGFEVRISNQDLTRWFWREPGDVQTSRERSIPNSVYNWQ
jgi:hypothetical protein